MENPGEKHHWSFLPPREFGSMSSQEYIVERINQYREWYDKKATTAKNTYLYMRTITVLGGAIVPVLINVTNNSWMKFFTSGISLMVVILISLESVYHYREQWKNYRSTEQLIAKEYFNFSTAEGPFKKMQKEDAFILLVTRVENAIESENASTLNVMTTVSEQKNAGEKNEVKSEG
jgi:hypothetical protein